MKYLSLILYITIIMRSLSKRLILIRHGESIWNLNNKYTGWVDVPLTKLGENQSKIAGYIMKENNIIPGISYTSVQKRCLDTNDIILKEMNIHNKISTIKSWRLNERHYGKLTGHDRGDIKWKGDFFDIPPLVEEIDNINISKQPDYYPEYGESYYMTYVRFLPLWNSIYNDILNNRSPMICSHKNTLKIITKHLECINNNDVKNIDIPNSVPIIYHFDNNMNVIDKIVI